MERVVCRAFGPLTGLEVVSEPDPVPGDGQVLVEVAAAGVNYVDGLMVQGRYQLKPALPFTPGMEVAGTVTAVGPGAAPALVGRRVLVVTGLGGFASHVVVPELALSTVPDNLALPSAAAFVQSYATARFTLTRRTHVEPGETVVVLGAGGGVGLAMIDVAKSLGATVIAAASSPEKLGLAVAAGADETIATGIEDLKAQVRELTGSGADVVVDPVGGMLTEAALRSTRRFGRLCVIGFASGEIPTLAANQILLNNRTVVGVDWGAWMFADGAGHRALLDELLADVEAGRLHPVAPAERPLREAAAAMDDLLERRVAGKLVLVP